MNRKFTQMACRLLLVAAVFLFLSPHLQAQGSDKWNGSDIATEFAGGNGEEATPYQISSAAELAYLAQQVNLGNSNGGSDYSGKYFVLMNDIDLDNHEWTPIGSHTPSSSSSFNGVFNGQKHIISNLKISTSSLYTAGLFALTGNGSIQNLGVILGEEGLTRGNIVGGLVGKANSTIIKNCFITGSLIKVGVSGGAGLGYVGGIVGQCEGGSIENCYTSVDCISINAGTNTGYMYLGGIMGYSENGSVTIKNCICFNGKIVLIAKEGYYDIYANLISGSSCTLDSNYSSAFTTITEDLDTDDKTTIPTENEANGSFVNNSNYNDLFSKWDQSVWQITPGYLPSFGGNPSQIKIEDYVAPSGNGEESSPYELMFESQLRWLANGVNENDARFNGKHFKLTSDIVLTAEWDTPIGIDSYSFTGTFDGDNHTVTLGIKANTNLAQAGLFGTINTGATVQKVAVKVTSNGIASTATGAPSTAGAIAAVNKGTIKQCYVTGDGTVLSADGSDSYAGGIAGDNSGTISDCYNLTSVKVEKGSNAYAGGIAGHNTWTVEYCFAAGEVSTNAGAVVNSLSIPAEAAGGIVGFNDSENTGVVKNCLAVNSFLSLEGHRVIGTGGDTDDINNFAYNDMPRPTSKSADVYDPLEGTPLTTGNLNSETGGCFNGWNTSVWDLNSFATLPKLQGFTSQTEKAIAPYLLYTVTIAPFSNGTLSITRQDPQSGLTTVNNNDLVSYNTELTITATPDADYELKALTVNGSDFSSGSVYTVNSGITVKAEFSKKGTDPVPDPTPTPDPSPVPPTVYYTVTLPAVEGVTTDPSAGDYEVEAWSSFRFYLTLDKDYDLSEPVVTTDRGETIAPQSSGGAYIVKYVRSDVQIFIDGVMKNPDPVANETVKTNLSKVWATEGHLHIEAATDGRAYIFTADGRPQKIQPVTAGETITLPLPEGVYIVLIGDERFKVLL